METENKAQNEQGFHYQFGADGTVPDKPKKRQSAFSAAGKAALSVPIAFGVIFGGAMILIAYMLIGAFTVFLGGGTLLCAGLTVYMISNGIQHIAAAATTGVGILGFGFLLASCTGLFLFAANYWIRRIVPSVTRYFRKLRGFLGMETEGES